MRAERHHPGKAFLFLKPISWLTAERGGWLFLGILFLILLHVVIFKGRNLLFRELGLGTVSLLLGWLIARSPRWRVFAERMGRFWKNDFCIAAVVILYIVMVLRLLPRVFSTNDDMGILSDIRGGFAAGHMSLILGRFLSLLYDLAPSFPFYGIFLYFMHACSLYLFIKTFSRLRRFAAWFPFFLIAYLSLYALFLMEVGYNNASFMIGINALMYGASRLLEEERRTVVFMLSGLLFAFCFMVRTRALFGVLLFSAVIFASLLIRDKRSWKGLAIFFIPVLLIVSTDHLIARYGVSETYKAFHRFNTLREALRNSDRFSRNINNPHLLRANGWTKNDMTLFKYRFFPNERKFNDRTMKNFFLEKRPRRPLRPRDVLSRTGRLIKAFPIQFLFLASLLLSTIFLTGFKENTFVLLNAVYFSAGFLAMDTFMKLPHRIGDPLFLLPLESTVLFVFQDRINDEPRKAWNRPLTAFFVAVCMVVLSLNGLGYGRRVEALNSRMKKEREISQRINAAYTGALFLATSWPWSQDRDPLRESKDTYERIPFSWMTFSEQFYDIIGRRVEVEQGYDLFPRFLRLKNAYIIGRTAFIRGAVTRYLWENYGLKCKFITVERLDKSVGIFRVFGWKGGQRKHRTAPDK